MVDQHSPFSYNIRQAFLDYIAAHGENSEEEIENIPNEIPTME